MRNIKYLFFMILCLHFCFNPCVYADDEFAYGGTLVISSLTEPGTLNPLIAQDTVAMGINAMIFNSLISFNDRFEPVPDLAESWTISDNGLVWTFFLKKGIYFHDGKELTTGDVIFTYNRIMDPDLRSPFSPYYSIVKSFEPLGKYVFRVILKEPYAPFIYRMDQAILPSHLLKGDNKSIKDFGKNPVGTGPFIFDSWENGEITLSANKKYFNERPYLNKVIIRAFPTRLSAFSNMMQGKVDVVDDLDFRDYKIIMDDSRFQVYDFTDGFYYTILFNLDDPLFKEKKIRRAINLAVDTHDIIENALRGWGVPASGPFLPATWPCNPDIMPGIYNPREAISILKELGWEDTDGNRILDKGGKDLSFTILIDSGDSVKDQAVRSIRMQLFQVGIRVDIEVVSQEELFRNRLFPGNFQTALLQFTVGIEPDAVLSLFWHSSSIGRSNLSRYFNIEVDSLIEKARITMDNEERQKIYRKLHELIADDLPVVFLFFRRRFVGVSSKFDGVNIHPMLYYRSIGEWYIIK